MVSICWPIEEQKTLDILKTCAGYPQEDLEVFISLVVGNKIAKKEIQL
jgi:hypothetical protein